jgi:hypothetical protein
MLIPFRVALIRKGKSLHKFLEQSCLQSNSNGMGETTVKL